MQFRYVINDKSYVVVDDRNGYHGVLFKNGCSRNLIEKRTETLSEMEDWIEKLRGVFTMGADVIRERYLELLNEAKKDIAKQLNEEFDEIIMIVKNEIYVDCSDLGQPNVKIS